MSCSSVLAAQRQLPDFICGVHQGTSQTGKLRFSSQASQLKNPSNRGLPAVRNSDVPRAERPSNGERFESLASIAISLETC